MNKKELEELKKTKKIYIEVIQNGELVNKFSNYDGSKTTTKYIFHNIPTELGDLNISKLDDILEKKEV
jgi:hypothetical protein